MTAPRTVPPLSLIRPQYDEGFERIQSLFENPIARRIGLKAILQRYDVRGKSRHEKQSLDTVILVMAAEDADRYIPLPSVACACGLDERDAADITKLLADIEHHPVSSDMAWATSDRLWALTLPYIVMLQAENVCAAIEGHDFGAKTMEDRTLLRAAFGCLLLPEPRSAHRKLQVIEDAHSAAAIMRKFREPHYVTVQEAGYTLGAFEIDQFIKTIGQA
jgi:hypothetical protein